MVLVQHLRRGLDVQVVRGLLTPGQFDHPFQIGPDRRRLGGVRMHLLQTLELLFTFLQDLVRHLRVFDAGAKLGNLLSPFIQFTQFFLNGLELLPEEILSLGFVHLPLGLRLDFLLHGEDFDLFGQNLADPLQPHDGIRQFQDVLRHLHLEPEVRDDHVRQATRVVHVFDHHHDVRHQHLT